MSMLLSFVRAKMLIKEGIEKVSHPGLKSAELSRQVNITAEAIKKPTRFWTDSDTSEIEGNCQMSTKLKQNL